MKPEATISEIRLRNKGELNPLLVEFLNGEVSEKKLCTLKVKLKPYENLKEKVVQISTPDNQKYVNDPINKLLFDNRFIVIRNKKTNKMRLVEVGITPLINTLYFKKVTMSRDNRDIKEQIATLNRLFGTKKAVKRLERREALDIDKSHIEVQISEFLEESLALNSLDERNINNLPEDDFLQNLIPPCHREAVDILKVYRVEDCISEEELSSLEDGVQKVLELENNLQSESLFMQEYLPQALKYTENLKVRISCLLYADALINYLRASVRNLAKISENFCPYSKLIGEKIVKEFCVKSGNTLNRPLGMKDKAICYVIVLILIACNYKIDLEKLAKISQFGYKKLKQFGRIIGALPMARASTIHVLALPLPPPVRMVKKFSSNLKRR